MRNVQLNALCKINMGQSPESSSYNTEKIGLPFYQGNADFGNMYPRTRIWCSNPKKIAEKDDVLLSVRAPIGAVNITQERCCIGRGVCALTPIEGVCNPHYLYYLIKSKNDTLNRLGTGSTFKAVGRKTIEQLSVPDYSWLEQQNICQNLQKLDDIIECRNKEVRLLNELVQSRFVELFEDPNIPKVRLGECCIINPKKSSDNRLSNNDLMVSFVSMSDVSENGQVVTRHHKQYKSVKSGFTYFAENDVLFAKITPCMENGKGGIAKGLLNGIGFGSTEFHVLRPISGVTNSYWLYELTSFPQFRKAAEVNMTGSAGQRRVPASFLANYRVSLPPIGLQNQFADFVQQLDKSKLAVQKSLEELETLKKSLMQQYFG